MNDTTEDRDSPAPRVIGSPAEIWLNYGEIERDCTHAECYAGYDAGGVTWCEDGVFDSDVKYINGERYQRVLLALSGLYEALRRQHYGRMPEELQIAYDAAATALVCGVNHGTQANEHRI